MYDVGIATFSRLGLPCAMVLDARRSVPLERRTRENEKGKRQNRTEYRANHFSSPLSRLTSASLNSPTRAMLTAVCAATPVSAAAQTAVNMARVGLLRDADVSLERGEEK